MVALSRSSCAPRLRGGVALLEVRRVLACLILVLLLEGDDVKLPWKVLSGRIHFLRTMCISCWVRGGGVLWTETARRPVNLDSLSSICEKK